MAGFGFQRSLQILALDAIVRPDQEAIYRHMCRWYSKNFHVPLPDVIDLPIADVIREYYEGIYDEMDAEELSRVAAEICETDEDRVARLAAEAKKLSQEASSVTASMERIRKQLAATKGDIVKAVDTLGKLRTRPSAKTVADLRAADDVDGLGGAVADILKSAPQAPKPRAPEEFFGMAPVPEFKYSVESFPIDDDMDAIGGNLPKKKP